MKRKIIAIICLLATSMNISAFAAETLENSNSEIIIENTEITEETVGEENADIIIEEENSENIVLFSFEDKKEILKKLIDGVENTSPGEVATEDSFLEYKTALENANAVYKDTNADADSVDEAIQQLKDAINALSYVAKAEILTPNKLSDKQKEEHYPETDFAEVAAAYTYSEGSPLAAQDAGKTKLSDGIGSEFYAVDGSKDSEIIYDLGDTYFVTGTDVFSKFMYFGADKSMRMNMKGYTVSVSTDGSIYKNVAEVEARREMLPENEAMGFEYSDLITKGAFPAAEARYVKITVLADTELSSQYNIVELVIKGFKSPYSRDDLYTALLNCSDVDKSVTTSDSYSKYISAYRKAEKLYWNTEASGREVFLAKSELEKAYNELVIVGTSRVLSGNISSTKDKEYYQSYLPQTGEQNSTLSNLSYQFITFEGKSSNPQIVSQDTSFNKLLQGGTELTDVNSLLYGTWDNANPANILFNLGEECYITGADVWEYYNGVSTRAGKVRVYISNDGVNFKKVSEIINPKNDGEEKTYNVIPQDFEPVKGRYLLVVVEKGDSHQITLNEVVIKGFKTAQKENIPFFIEKTDYKNAFGTRIIELDGNGSVTVSGTAVSNIPEDKDVIVVTAAYKDGDIVAWDFENVSVSGFGKAEFSNTIDLDGESDVELYSYVWESFLTRKAMSDIKKFGSI